MYIYSYILSYTSDNYFGLLAAAALLSARTGSV